MIFGLQELSCIASECCYFHYEALHRSLCHVHENCVPKNTLKPSADENAIGVVAIFFGPCIFYLELWTGLTQPQFSIKGGTPKNRKTLLKKTTLFLRHTTHVIQRLTLRIHFTHTGHGVPRTCMEKYRGTK